MDFKSYIMENALVLIPVLNIIGVMIKSTDKIKNSYIPIILLGFGIAGAVALMGWSGQSVIQGVLVAGAAVYGHQFVTHGKKCLQSRTENKQTSVDETPAQAQEDDDISPLS